jgi:hypothetical protein
VPSGRWTSTLPGLSSTAGFPTWFPDTAIGPFSARVACVVNSSAISYNVESQPRLRLQRIRFIGRNVVLVRPIGGHQQRALASFGFPVSAIRVSAVSGGSTGVIAVTAIQAG